MELWTAFALGLVGSLHCAGMCGPLMLVLPATGRSWSGFITGRALYHLGRLLAYAVLGVLFGGLGRTLWLAGLQRWVSLGVGLGILLGWWLGPRLGLPAPMGRALGWVTSRWGRLLDRRTLLSLGLLGGLNGFLPCGLVYVAGATAGTLGSPLRGASYMLLFGLGTTPMMLGLSLSGRWLRRLAGRRPQALVTVAVVGVSTLLILRGLGLGIPFLSPALRPQTHPAATCPCRGSGPRVPQGAVAPQFPAAPSRFGAGSGP